MNKSNNDSLFLGQILDFSDDPCLYSKSPKPSNLRHIEKGALLVRNGKVVSRGMAADLQKKYPHSRIIDYSPYLILPGFIDSHLHYPQTEMIASYGESLLKWLELYTFPVEAKFSSAEYASRMAKFFINELVRNGTTTAFVFPSSHKESVNSLFEEALAINMRLGSGKVMMDRNAPPKVLSILESDESENEELIKKWHNNHRLMYALTPRFAPTSSPAQLELVFQLKQKYPEVYIQTHVAEHLSESKWVASLFPKARSYLDVYESFSLLSDKTILAHCLYLDNTDWQLVSDRGCIISHCPSSNLFLGSGLFPWDKARKSVSALSIASDVGGGSSFSMLQTLQDAYKVSTFSNCPLSSLDAFYLATLGAAKSLKIDEFIGNFDTDKEADFVVINPKVSPLQNLRWQNANSLNEQLFSLMILGDDRNIHSTYINGKKVFENETRTPPHT